MNKDVRSKIEPKLRFPEFKDSQEWEDKTLADICSITNGKSNAQDHVEDGLYPLFDRSEVIKASNNYIFDCEAIIIPGEGMRFIPKYYIGKFDLHQRAYALKDFTSVGLFAFYSIATRSNLLAEKAVKSTVLSLRLPILQNFPIQVPFDKEEEQKIADCLASLDELITAQSQLLQTLKAHKKGLMQQLFPAEGETIPKLRFPEFKENEEWKVEALGGKGIASFINERMPLQELKLENYVSTENLLSDYGGKVISSRLPSSGSFTRFKKGDILISNIRPYLKKVWFSDIDGAASNDVIVIRASSKINASFLAFLLKNDDFITYIMKGAEGVKMPRGDKDLIKEYPLVFSKKDEQQKIVDCLFPLDEQISAQTEKIEALKGHKKGLMQALFPQLNETVNG